MSCTCYYSHLKQKVYNKSQFDEQWTMASYTNKQLVYFLYDYDLFSNKTHALHYRNILLSLSFFLQIKKSLQETVSPLAFSRQFLPGLWKKGSETFSLPSKSTAVIGCWTCATWLLVFPYINLPNKENAQTFLRLLDKKIDHKNKVLNICVNNRLSVLLVLSSMLPFSDQI